jgi:hypothetical protein
MTDRDDRIRELAYSIWREEGCPEGHAERHWLAAEIIVLESEEPDRKRVEGEPPGEPVGESRTVSGLAGAASHPRRRGADSE